MSLLTVAQVQDWVPQATGEEGLLSDAIEMAEGLADEYCDRPLLAIARTEYHTVEERQSSVQLRAYPVDTTAAFTVLEDAESDTPTTLDSSDYILDNTAGILYRDSGYWLPGPRNLKVTYTAGYTSATLPAGLRRALLQLVAWVLESRGNVGTRQESVDGHQWTSEDMDGAVPASIGAALRPWKAVRIG